MNILEEIVAKKNAPYIFRFRDKPLYSFSSAIRQANNKGKIGLIAEIKPKSPSMGTIKQEVDVSQIARIYHSNGASCISILTEYNFFGGKAENLIEASRQTTLPLLRKDFITELTEINYSFTFNADAILLIVKLLGKEKLAPFLQQCNEQGMDALVEVHSQTELDIALNANAKLIGINNRDLTTFKVDLQVTKKLSQEIPNDCLIISESGIKTKEDVEQLASWGVHGILVGTELMKSQEMDLLVREMADVNLK